MKKILAGLTLSFALASSSMAFSETNTTNTSSVSVRTSQIVAALIRNAGKATVALPEGFGAFLSEHGFAPDLSSVMTLAFAPAAIGNEANAEKRPVTLRTNASCAPIAGQGKGEACRVIVLQKWTEEGAEKVESAVIFIFHLDGPASSSSTRIIGPVKVELAG